MDSHIFKNKKAFLSTEAILWLMTFVFFILFFFSLNNSLHNSEDEFETLIPEISNELPSIFVYNYLTMELNEEDKILFSQDPNSNLKVMDLYWIDSEESINKAKEYRTNYLSIIENLDSDFLESYESLSGKSYDLDDLIFEVKNPDPRNGYDLNQIYQEDKNAFYFIGSRNGNYYYIFFDGRNLQ